MLQIVHDKLGRYRIKISSLTCETSTAVNDAKTLMKALINVIDEIDQLLGIKRLTKKESKKNLILKRINKVIALYNAKDPSAGTELAALGLFGKQLRDLQQGHIETFRSLAQDITRQSHNSSWVGIRSEVAMAALLLEVFGPGFVKRESPDFEIFFNCKPIYIEVTSTHLSRNKGPECIYKIGSTLKKKNDKPYANNNTVPAIDITNIYHHFFNDKSLLETDFSTKLDRIISDSECKYGALVFIIFCGNHSLNRYQMNYTSHLINKCSPDVRHFVEKYFPSNTQSTLVDPTFLQES